MEDIHISKIDGKEYEIAILVTYTKRKDHDITVVLDTKGNEDPAEIVCHFYGRYDFEYVESQIRKYINKNK